MTRQISEPTFEWISRTRMLNDPLTDRLNAALITLNDHGCKLHIVDYCEDARTPGLLGQIKAVTDRDLREVKISMRANKTDQELVETMEHEARHVADPSWDCGNRDVFGRGGR